MLRETRRRQRWALDTDLARTLFNLKALVNPRFNEDVTVLLVKRTAGSPD